MKQNALLRCILAIAQLPATWPTSAQAAEYSLLPSITMRGEYSDNIRLTTAPHDSVWGVGLQPRLGAKYATETTELSGTGGLNIKGYTQESDLNAVDLLVKLSGRQSYATGQVGFGVDYVRDSTLASELEQTGLVLTRKQRDSLNLRPDWTWQITQRTGLTLGYQYTDVSYQDAQSAGLVNYRNHTFSSALRYEISPRSDVIGTLAYQQYEPSGSTAKVDTTSLLVRYSQRFSETLRGSAGIGLASTSSRGFPSGDTQSDRVLGHLGLERQFENGQVAVHFSRDVGPSGSGGLTQTDRAALEWLGKLRETLSLRVAGAAYHTRFIDQQQNGQNGSKYYQVEPRLTWQATSDWGLEAGYRYQWRKNEFETSSADANTLYLNAIYNWPKQAISR